MEAKTISSSAAQQVFAEMFETGKSPAAIVQEKGLAQVSDTGAIEKFCDEAIAANPRSGRRLQSRQSRRAEFPQRPGDEVEQGQGEPGARRRNFGKETEELKRRPGLFSCVGNKIPTEHVPHEVGNGANGRGRLTHPAIA